MDAKPSSPERQEGPAVERIVFEAAALGEAEVPSEILVAPWGEVRSTVGSFVVDEESAAAAIRAFEEHGTDLPIDYEHQTLGGAYASPNGQAPAAGWVRALRAVTPAEAESARCEPGLWAEVAWTAEAEAQLRNRKYRYLSPVALVRRDDRRLVGLHSAALTNKPAIVGMRPLITSSAASDDDAIEALAMSRLRTTLGIDESATEDVVLVTAAQRIVELERQDTARRAADCVERAQAAGKLTAAQREWALSLAMRDPAEFERWEGAAPVVVPLGRTTPPGHASVNARRQRTTVEAAARAEWQANRVMLEGLCTEQAFIDDALRAASAET